VKQAAVVVSLNFVLIAVSSLNLAAQSHKIASPQKSVKVEPANGPAAGLTRIYSNLGSKTDAYDDGFAYQVTGPGNPLWGIGYAAMPFTPAKNSTVKQILIALATLGGDDTATLGIFTDANGVPGKVLRSWNATNFPITGSCCQLVSLKDYEGLTVSGGQRYWLVAGTGLGQDNGLYVWSFVWNDSSGTLAFLNGNTNDKWLQWNDNVAAFAVYGDVQ
jgi:hypothetical protein